MANFLIASPNSLTQGTDSNDLFVLNTALGATVYGNDGADQISASVAVNGVNAIFNGGQGNDSIYLTAGAAAQTLTVAKVVGGGDNDLIVIDGAVANNSTVHGGGGADSILLSGGAFTQSTINAMGGIDLVSASGTNFVSSLLSLGGGNDTLNLISASAVGTTIAAGGGNDLISAIIATGGATRFEGDTIGDSEYYGNDTIRIGGTLLGESALVQGGGGADIVSVSAVIGTGSTINGNAGGDSILLASAGAASSLILIGGGAGADTITVSAVFVAENGTIFGGGGNDLISVSAQANVTGMTIYGGEGSDTIGLGTTVDGQAIAANVRYTSFSDSNLSAFDYISSTVAVSGGFTLSQTVVTATTAGSLSNGAFTTNTGGVVTWVSAAGGGVTARAQQIDQFLGQGQVAVFADGNGEDYIFIQAGAAGSGTGADLIAQLNTSVIAGASTGFNIVAGSAISLNLA